MVDSCPVCKSVERKKIGFPRTNSISSKFVTKDFKVVQCTNCGLYYVSPKIEFSNDQWTELYNSEYFSNQTNWLIKKRKKELSDRFDVFKNLVVNKNSKLQYLDVGAGEGKGLIEALNRGWEATGLDIVDNRMDDAKLPKVKFIKSTLLESNLEKNYYDFIYVDSVIEHVLNPLEYLSRIKDILKPGGVLYIGVPNEDCLFNSIRKLVFSLTGKRLESEKIKPFDVPYHVIGFNKKSLTYIFNKAGLKVLRMRNFGRKFDFLSFPPTNKSFWINLFFLLPIEYAGLILRKDIYFEAYLTKD